MKASQALRDRVAACLAAGDSTEGAATKGAAAAFDKLRLRLGRVIGAIGFDALVHRAVVLARQEHGGSPDHLDEATLFINAAEPAAGTRASDTFVTAVAANAVLLLVTFIGEPLTLKILQDVWPQLAPTGADLAVADEESSK
jgi:hypothetical protein